MNVQLKVLASVLLIGSLAACGGGSAANPGVGSGTIQNWPAGSTGTVTFDIQQPGSSQPLALGTSAINASGQFSYSLSTPPASALSTINPTCSGTGSIVASNPNAKGNGIAFGRTQIVGQAVAGNISLSNAAPLTSGQQPVYPATFAQLTYVDSAVSVTGTCTTGSGASAVTQTNNANLVAGWNLVIGTQSSATQQTITASTSLPSGVNWYYSGPRPAASSLSIQWFQ